MYQQLNLVKVFANV